MTQAGQARRTRLMGDLEQDLSSLEPGSHICLIHAAPTDDDKDGLVCSFVREGLRRGDRCLLAVAPFTRDAVRSRLAVLGVAVNRLQEQGALVFIDPRETYLSSGGFDPERSARLVGSLVDESRAQGYNGFRGVGDVGADLIAEIDPVALASYEVAVDRVLAETGARAMCVYRRSAGETLIAHALRSHRHTLLGKRLCSNPFCNPPAFPSGEAGDQQRNDWTIAQILHNDENQRLLREMNQALMKEAIALASENNRRRTDADALSRAAEARGMLLGMIARQLQAPLPQLRSAVDVLGREERPHARRDAHDLAREQIECLALLVKRLEEAAALARLDLVLQPQETDMVELVRALAAALARRERGAQAEARMHAPAVLRGSWDRLRLSQVTTGLLEAAADASWGTPIDVRLESLGPMARMTLRFRAPEVDPADGSVGLNLEAVQSPPPRHDQLGIALWPAREIARAMGGTVGVSVWADETVTFTLELPRQLGGSDLPS